MLPQWGQRSFTAENLLSSGENLALQILHRSCHLEQLFLLLDLSEKDYMKNIDSKYLDAVKAKDGKNYMAPYNVNFMGVYYNKDKFEEAGYTMPTKWDELIALAEEIKAKGETPFILPNPYLLSINSFLCIISR